MRSRACGPAGRPRRIPVASHTVHAGWFTTEQDEHMIMVCSCAPRRLDLLVVPPQTDGAEALRLMAGAAGPANTRTASALLSAEPEAGPDFLPSAVTPSDGPGEADLRADTARSRAASWSAPAWPTGGKAVPSGSGLDGSLA
ncbi:DUF5994 family protein [Kitasatospora sp. NPDC085879]|uniref:DUF5994 family protein n=1 Tax=Kitasatospora sp. NPDC085879 TaxID=3154769 RepID=UPI00342AF6C0